MEGFMTAIIQFLEALESFYVVERDGLRDMAFHSAQLDLSPEHRRKFKLCKVRSVQFGQKVIPYLNTYDDRTIRYPDPLIKANDTIKIDLETNKIMDFIKLYLPFHRLHQVIYLVRLNVSTNS
ncbi:40S ribosomal protein S4-3 [Zea mays]|uniref:40S ribosomal protein S4-3 n=1 Tax=Zea mays TaxID=4577 RepID=A0A1D6EIV1_MAIZE|nr:40S ribosomal protein S4-3 [Zea mays]